MLMNIIRDFFPSSSRTYFPFQDFFSIEWQRGKVFLFFRVFWSFEKKSFFMILDNYSIHLLESFPIFLVGFWGRGFGDLWLIFGRTRRLHLRFFVSFFTLFSPWIYSKICKGPGASICDFLCLFRRSFLLDLLKFLEGTRRLHLRFFVSFFTLFSPGFTQKFVRDQAPPFEIFCVFFDALFPLDLLQVPKAPLSHPKNHP